MQTDQEEYKGLNILCIDGGGVRGLSSLIILQEIMLRVENARGGNRVHPYEYFDVIAGTGTGGISACMLGRLRMPIEKAIEKYANLVKEVFKEKKMSGPTMYKATKLQETLKTMIREATGDEMAMMSEDQNDNPCKTMVFAMGKHNLNAALPVIFRSYPATTNPGPNCAIWEALRATTAHPDLFKSIDIVESSVIQSFVGGEIGCSNPLVHVLVEVERVWPGRQVACVISIGTGHARTIQVSNTSRWYRAQDVMVMKDMATDSERVAQEMLVRFQRTSQVYFRFNVDQGLQDVKKGSWERLGETMQHAKAYLQKHETDLKLNEAVRSAMERRGVVSTVHGAGQIFSAPENGIGFKHCPAPTKLYTGRVAENAQVITCITAGKNERRVCVVYGLGGVGKTQLVLNVIERTWDEWDYIIYIDASSTESIEKALAGFGKAKGVDKTSKGVVSWLESCTERWLLVFDNVDTPVINVRQYIPARGRGSVLITTRLPDLARLAEGPNSVCHLSSMSKTDGTELLVKIVGLGNDLLPDDDMMAAEELVQNLGGLALAIVHAGAYIAHSAGMTITRYQNLFLSQRRRMLEEYNQLPVTAKLEERGDTVYTTWRISYDQLMPESRELLGLIAYLHYTGISEDIFKRAAAAMHSKTYPLPLTGVESQAQSYVKRYLSSFLNADGSWDAVSFIRVMSDLTSFSLIDFDRVNLTYRVHVLVHDWAKSVADAALAVEYTATLLSLSIDHQEDTTSLAFKNQLGLHVTTVLTHKHDIGPNHGYYFEQVYDCTGQWEQQIKLLQRLVEAFNNLLGEDHSDTLDSMSRLAWAHQCLGQYDEAEQLDTEVLNAHKRTLGIEDPTTLGVMSDLAWIYSCQGQNDKAKQLGVQVIDHYRRLLGAEHPSTLTSMSNLASVYSSLGQYDKAEQLGTQVISARKRVLGAEHPSTLDTINNLALTYLDMGQYDKAEQLGLQIIDLRKRLLGIEHPDTLVSTSNLACVYSRQGQYNKAEQLGLQAIELRKRVLGVEHPDTLVSTSNLACVYSRQGQYNKAEQLGLQAIELRKRVLGVEHPDTLTSMSNLAWVYSCQGQYEKAEQLGIQVISARKRVLGAEHPSTLDTMSNLAAIYSDMGQYDKAEQLGLQVIDLRKRVLGIEHPDTLTSMSNLAWVYSCQDQYDKAEQLGTQVISARKRVLGAEHPSTLDTMSNLAAIYSDMGQYDKAEQLGLQIFDLRKRVLGAEHRSTLISMSNLAWVYSCQGQYNKAEQLGLQSIELRKRVLGVEHPDTLTSMSNLAWVYSRQGQYNKAEQLGLQAIELRKRVLGVEHPDTLTSMSNLAWVYSCQGQYNKAEQLGLQAIDLRKRLLGIEHPDTLASMSNLAWVYSCQGQYEKAEQLGTQVISARKRVLGAEHHSTIHTMGILASTYLGMGQYDKAEKLGVETLDAFKRLLGVDHPATLFLMSTLAATYSKLGQYDNAESLGAQVVDIRKRVLGDEHPDTLDSTSGLASTYLHLGKHDEANNLQSWSLDACKRVLGDEHPTTLKSMHNLALVFSDLGRWDEAEELCRKTLNIAERILGDQHPSTRQYRTSISRIHDKSQVKEVITSAPPLSP